LSTRSNARLSDYDVLKHAIISAEVLWTNSEKSKQSKLIDE